jgi:hypothetical protein
MTTESDSGLTINEALRLLAGLVVLLGLLIGQMWSVWGYVLIGFVGLNLIQSSFTGWCPAMWIFRRLGMKE